MVLASSMRSAMVWMLCLRRGLGDLAHALLQLRACRHALHQRAVDLDEVQRQRARAGSAPVAAGAEVLDRELQAACAHGLHQLRGLLQVPGGDVLGDLQAQPLWFRQRRLELHAPAIAAATDRRRCRATGARTTDPACAWQRTTARRRSPSGRCSSSARCARRPAGIRRAVPPCPACRACGSRHRTSSGCHRRATRSAAAPAGSGSPSGPP